MKLVFDNHWPHGHAILLGAEWSFGKWPHTSRYPAKISLCLLGFSVAIEFTQMPGFRAWPVKWLSMAQIRKIYHKKQPGEIKTKVMQ